MKSLPIKLLLLIACFFITGCAYNSNSTQEIKIGSSISKNLFVDSTQFTNPKVKIRLRNSSGDESINISALQADIERSLVANGYEIDKANAGIVLDINLFFFNTVKTARNTSSNGVSTLLGGVIGYELAKGGGDISGGSGAIIGAITGATMADVLRAGGDSNSYLGICDVNIGILRSKSGDASTFSIGGNPIEHSKNKQDSSFESFERRDTVKVSVYASNNRKSKDELALLMQQRLAKIISNIF